MTIEEYLELYNNFNTELDKLCEVFPYAFETNLVGYTWVAFDWLLESVAKENELDVEDLSWFIFENAQGKNGFELGSFTINNLDDFMLFEKGTHFNLKNGREVVFDVEEVNEDEIAFNYIPDDLTDEEVEELGNAIEKAIVDFVERESK